MSEPAPAGAVVPFSFDGAEVRVVMRDGEPWFVAKDAAKILGYADPTTAVKSHCRGVQKLHPIPDALGRMQNVRVLAESDLLRLVVGSHLPAAEKFERWVFEDVLPTIRKTGSYTVALPAWLTFDPFPTNWRTKKLAKPWVKVQIRLKELL